MKRTTVVFDKGTSREVGLLAQREKVPAAVLVRDALKRNPGRTKRGKELTPRFLAAGRSGHHDTAERAEELLWADFRTHSTPHWARARGRK